MKHSTAHKSRRPISRIGNRPSAFKEIYLLALGSWLSSAGRNRRRYLSSGFGSGISRTFGAARAEPCKTESSKKQSCFHIQVQFFECVSEVKALEINIFCRIT